MSSSLPPRANRRPLRRRAYALLWALAFVLGTVGEGFGLHACPHHEGVGADHAAAAEHDAGHEPHGDATAPRGAMAGHDGADTVGSEGCHSGHAARHTGDSADPHDDHSGPCTCGSVCQAPAGLAVPAIPRLEPFAAAVSAARAAPPTAESTAPTRPPYFLPFAQAPPQAG